MNAILRHLVVLPVVVPLIAGAVMFFLAEARRTARVLLAATSILIQLAVAIGLLYLTSDAAPYIWPTGVGVYAIGGWPAPFGIVLGAPGGLASLLDKVPGLGRREGGKP